MKKSFFVLKQYMRFSRNSFRLHIVMVQEADFMSIRLVIDGNAVYEIDEDCEVCRRNKEKEEERRIQRTQEGNTGKKQKT